MYARIENDPLNIGPSQIYIFARVLLINIVGLLCGCFQLLPSIYHLFFLRIYQDSLGQGISVSNGR